MKISGDAVQDLISGLGPYKWPGVVVPGAGPGPEVCFEFFDAAVGGAAELAVGQFGEPPLHQVEPGGTGRGEVQAEAGVADQPVADGGGLVGGVVVADQMQVQVRGGGGVDGLEELEK